MWPFWKSRTVPLAGVVGAANGRRCAPGCTATTAWTSGPAPAFSALRTTDDGVVVELDDVPPLEADAVVVGIGITPNVSVAAASGLHVDNGIVVDAQGRTSIPNVYAAGDVAHRYSERAGRHVRVEHFDNANKQGAAVANAMLGRDAVSDEASWFWSDQYERNIQFVGSATGELADRGNVEDLDFTAFYLDGGVVRGAFAIDRGEDVMVGPGTARPQRGHRHAHRRGHGVCGTSSMPKTQEEAVLMSRRTPTSSTGAGCRVGPGDVPALQSRRPRDVVGTFPASGPADVRAAVDALDKAGGRNGRPSRPSGAPRSWNPRRPAGVARGGADRRACPGGGQDHRRGHDGGQPDADESAVLCRRGDSHRRIDVPGRRCQSGVHTARTGRHRRRDHPVELPAQHSVTQARARARRR